MTIFVAGHPLLCCHYDCCCQLRLHLEVLSHPAIHENGRTDNRINVRVRPCLTSVSSYQLIGGFPNKHNTMPSRLSNGQVRFRSRPGWVNQQLAPVFTFIQRIAQVLRRRIKKTSSCRLKTSEGIHHLHIINSLHACGQDSKQGPTLLIPLKPQIGT